MEVQGRFKPGEIPLLPWAKKLLDSRKPQDDPHAACMPMGVPRQAGEYPWRFIPYRKTHLFILWEGNIHSYRQIFMDGRSHPNPDDWNPSWHGHSIGRWDGDTLVIDNVGFNDITPGFAIHSEKLHVIERIRRPSINRLEIEITAEDPDAWTGPWTTVRYGSLAPDHEILEFVCPENNKDMKTFGGLGWKGRP